MVIYYLLISAIFWYRSFEATFTLASRSSLGSDTPPRSLYRHGQIPRRRVHNTPLNNMLADPRLLRKAEKIAPARLEGVGVIQGTVVPRPHQNAPSILWPTIARFSTSMWARRGHNTMVIIARSLWLCVDVWNAELDLACVRKVPFPTQM